MKRNKPAKKVLKNKILKKYRFTFHKEKDVENFKSSYWVKDRLCLFLGKPGFGNGYYAAIGFAFEGEYYAAEIRRVKTIDEVKSIYKAFTNKKLEKDEKK